jgi:hypothetical protein
MGQRLALIIGNSLYSDPTLARLLTPDVDVGALGEILLDAEIGGFDDVNVLVNMSSTAIRRAIASFFAKRSREDLLLLYFSGHGVLDDQGLLYLAVRDTDSKLLRGTAVSANFITDEMNNSHSQRQVLILDCCHSGAFARGSKGAPGSSVGTAAAFEGRGYGRVVLTASDATQYAWEGDQVIGDGKIRSSPTTCWKASKAVRLTPTAMEISPSMNCMITFTNMSSGKHRAKRRGSGLTKSKGRSSSPGYCQELRILTVPPN